MHDADCSCGTARCRQPLSGPKQFSDPLRTHTLHLFSPTLSIPAVQSQCSVRIFQGPNIVLEL